MVGDRARPALLGFFLPLTRRTCAELGVGDGTIATYLAEVLSERLDRVVEMLGLGPPTPGPAGERAFHRHVGDFALFMSGLFRSFVGRGGYLDKRVDDGLRAVHDRIDAVKDQLGHTNKRLDEALHIRERPGSEACGPRLR